MRVAQRRRWGTGAGKNTVVKKRQGRWQTGGSKAPGRLEGRTCLRNFKLLRLPRDPQSFFALVASLSPVAYPWCFVLSLGYYLFYSHTGEVPTDNTVLITTAGMLVLAII